MRHTPGHSPGHLCFWEGMVKVAKRFNVTGLCVPAKHYMVDMKEQVEQIKKMVDAGDYFTINRARQYGKTTTLAALAKALDQDYLVISLDFQALGSASFQNENAFSLAFLLIFLREMQRQQVTGTSGMDELYGKMQATDREKDERFDLLALFDYLLSVCAHSPKPVVLMIDETDSASNNQVFLDFLAQLRSYYLERDIKGTAAFQSVILAGVYDIRNLKKKLHPDEEHRVNSPWNIAADFDIDMSLSKSGIENMLQDYEEDHHTRMDTEELAGLLYDYTSGYPYLVSRLCKLIDEKVCSVDVPEGKKWAKAGFLESLRMLLSENNTLFETLIGKLEDYPELKRMLGELLFSGNTISYSPASQAIGLALMFGFVKNVDGQVIPANRIFDTFLYNYFLSADEMRADDLCKASLQDKNQFLVDGHLNMRRVMEKFVEHFHELYGNRQERFVEEEGMRYFLLYLRLIINGIGNYYIEAHTRSLGRTDIIVDYRGEQFVVETKIWRGNEYNSRGESRLTGYLDDYCLSTGYMLSFNFNQKKQIGVHEMVVDGKVLVEAVV